MSNMLFNDSQKKAIEHFKGPALVLAGPGSGKTAVITQRTYNLIEKYKVNPGNILVITFTKMAANEMKERFAKLTKSKELRVSFGTFHAIFFTILKHAYKFSTDNIISEELKHRFMQEIISKYHLEYKDENEFITNLFGEISTVKNSQININNYYSTQCGEEVFRKIYKEYEDKLRKSRLIDFDDMLTYTYELFSERKDILRAWQEKYKYILIDEFQDINRIQYEIIKMMALPENNLFIVGDDDQSIYRFRGSKPEIMLNFRKDYPDAKQILLDTNYRCGKYIVETSKNLISYNEERYDKAIIAASHDETPVKYAVFENTKDEVIYIIRQISELTKQGKDFKDIAVLFRTNTQARSLIEQLITYNVPFQTRDNIPNIYEHWIAKDIFTYMRIASGGRERKDFLQIMNRPKRYIGRDSLTDSEVSFEVWKEKFKEQSWIAERIDKLQCDLKMINRMNPYAAINYIRKGIGYDEFLKEYAEYRNINKEELYDVIDEIQLAAKGHKTYKQWREHIEKYTVELKKMSEKRKNNPDAITIATLHSAKGLEYNTVFLPDVNEGVMPYKKAVLDKDIEEERRLFYVGMTRAKQNLYIYSTKSMKDKNADISRFVEETKKAKKKQSQE